MNLAQVLLICPDLEVNVLKIELMGIVEQSKAWLWDTKGFRDVKNRQRFCRCFAVTGDLNSFPSDFTRCQLCSRKAVRNGDNLRAGRTDCPSHRRGQHPAVAHRGAGDDEEQSLPQGACSHSD